MNKISKIASENYVQFKKSLPEIKKKLIKVAKVVAIIAISILAFLCNPYSFATAAIIGFGLSKEIKNYFDNRLIPKIERLWKKHYILVTVGTVVGAYLALPVVVLAGTILWGGYWGAWIGEKVNDYEDETAQSVPAT